MAKNGAAFPEWDVTKVWGEMKVPGIDVEAWMAIQQKNLEVITEANKVVYEGVQAVAQRQAELVRDAMEQASKVAQDFTAVKTPEEGIAKQAELSKDAIQAGLANAREIGTMWSKSTNKAVDMVSTRMTKSLDEVKGIVDTPKAA